MTQDNLLLKDLVKEVSSSLRSMHHHQIERDGWPLWNPEGVASFSREDRRYAYIQWAGRAFNEYESIHQFAAVSHVLCTAQAPLGLQGGIARLITDEVRHAELCARLALLYKPEEAPAIGWKKPSLPWSRALDTAQDRQDMLLWAAEGIVTACCFGETLSVPMLQAISVVATEENAVAVARQILRDEHLHARYGWEALKILLSELGPADKETLQARLGTLMRGFESSCCQGVSQEDVLNNPSVTLEEGEPNLGVLTHHEYAVIFYHCLESEIFPKLQELGFDPMSAWLDKG